jgi:hypothetical protein
VCDLGDRRLRANAVAGIPLEAMMTELMLSGEIERNYRLLRLEGYAQRLRAEKLSPEVVAFEEALRARLGERVRGTSP